MPSGAKRRKAANKKKKEKVGLGGEGEGPNSNSNNNSTNNYPPSSTHLLIQGEEDSKSQDDRESENGSPISQENNDHEHPFHEENEAPERTDAPSIASELTGSNAEDPAGGNIVVEDDKRLVEVDKEVNILSSGSVDESVASGRKQEEDPSYALSSKASPDIEEVESQCLELEKEVVATETPSFEAYEILISSGNDGDEEKGIKEDACAGPSDAVSLDIEEKDVNSVGAAQILLEKGSTEDANGDVDANPVKQVDLDNTSVVPVPDMKTPVIDSKDSGEVMEVVEWRLSDNEEKELDEPSKVNGTNCSVSGLEGKVEVNVETSLDDDKTLTSANEEGDEAFPLVDENGETSTDGVDAVIADEEKVLIVTKEKEDGPIPVGDDMIESSTVAASATEIVDETKTGTPGAGLVDNVSNVEASDVAVKGIEGVLPRLSDSDTEKAGIDQENKKDRSLAAGTQPPVARPTGFWALVMSCCGLSEVFGVSKR